MSFLRRVFRTKKQTDMKRVSNLVQKAERYYHHNNPEKALSLFLKAIESVGPAPDDISAQEDVELSDAGQAFWGAAVCLDLLDRPDEEITNLLRQARIKSPVTAQRIEKSRVEGEARSAAEAQRDALIEVLQSPDKYQEPELMKAAEDLIQASKEQGDWWAPGNAAQSLIKAGQRDIAWKLLNSALLIAQQESGNIPSIYEIMGDLCKAEGRHHDAARQYFLACATAHGDLPKRAFDQVRISLKKAGLKEDAADVRDALIEGIGTMDNLALLKKLDDRIEKIKSNHR